MSMGELAYITPSVLAWARETAGYTRERVAEKLKVSVDTLTKWESGEERPAYKILYDFSSLYDRPLIIFYAPEPPKEESINEKFRSLPSEYINPLPVSVIKVVKKAINRKYELEEIEDVDSATNFKHFLSRIKNITNPSALAKEVREIIDFSVSEQFKINKINMFNVWREKVESLGVWVFKEPFSGTGQKTLDNEGSDNYCGFSIYDDNYPVIYLNSKMEDTRKIFTLFHELGHIIMTKGGIDFLNNMENSLKGEYQADEVFCNAFAGSFLVPDFLKHLHSDSFSESDVINLANKYKVSREVILRKYLDNKLINGDTYQHLVKKWKEEYIKVKKLSESNDNSKTTTTPLYYPTKKSQLGKKYLKLAFKRYYQNKYDEYQLAEYLGLKNVKTLHGLE